MKKNIKILICGVTLLALFIANVSQMAVYATNNHIGIIVNGNVLSLEQQPIMENGRTLVPLRAIFEELGAKVDWDGATQTITGTKGNSTIKLIVGNTIAHVDGKEVKMDVPAKVVNGRTLVPTRFVAESLGAKVDWDGGSRIVTITSAVVDRAAMEKYIELFYDTLFNIGDNFDFYIEALLSVEYYTLEEIQEMIDTRFEETNGFQKIFMDLGNNRTFSQSQVFMKRAIHYYDLSTQYIQNLLLYAIEYQEIDENDQEALETIEALLFENQENMEIAIGLFEDNLIKAYTHFELEYETYEKHNQ